MAKFDDDLVHEERRYSVLGVSRADEQDPCVYRLCHALASKITHYWLKVVHCEGVRRANGDVMMKQHGYWGHKSLACGFCGAGNGRSYAGNMITPSLDMACVLVPEDVTNGGGNGDTEANFCEWK